MEKKIAGLFFACLLILSGTRAFAYADDDDDYVPAPQPVPEAGSSVLLVGCTVAGLTGLRFYLQKRR